MKTCRSIGVLLLLCLCGAPLQAQAATLDDFIGIHWGTSMGEARKIALSNKQLKFEKQEDGVLGSISLRGGSYLGRPATWWYLCFVNDKFCHGFVDFQLDRDQRPLGQLRQVRQMLVAKYGEPFIDRDSHPHSDPSWEECFVVKPVFQCDWHFTTSGPNPEATTVRLFMHGPTMESAHMRLVYGNTAMSEKRDKIDHDLKSGAVPPAAAEDLQAKEAAVKGVFEKVHAAIKAGNGQLALEMRSRESLSQFTDGDRAFWLRMRPNPNYAPELASVSLRSRIAGVYYTMKDSHGGLNYGFDFFLLEDGQWKLHLTRVESHPPDELARAFWLPPDTAPFIEGGEDWSKIEVMPTGDPDWNVQATNDSVFLYIRFIHATDLPLSGSMVTGEPHPSEMIYTPGVSVGSSRIRDGIRFSVGEGIGTRIAKPKNQCFANYSLTFRRGRDESFSGNADTSAGVLRILGRWIDVRIPRDVLTNIPTKPLKIWVSPKAPATTFEYTVKDPPRSSSSKPKAAITESLPAIPAPDPLATAKQAMHAIAVRVIAGDPKAFDDLHNTANALYQSIDYAKDRERLINNIGLMRAAYTLLGEETGKGNANAFSALKRSLGVRHLDGAATDALGIAAAAGHAEALQMLLHHDQHKILKSSAVFALRASAEKNNAQAIAFLLAVLDNPKERALWYGAATGLAAAKDNPKVQAALEKYEKAGPWPAAPSK
jgi:hypothetical protein